MGVTDTHTQREIDTNWSTVPSKPNTVTEHSGPSETTAKPKLQCDPEKGPRQGPCAEAVCAGYPKECTLKLEYIMVGDSTRNTCCPKNCNYVDVNGVSCKAGPVDSTSKPGPVTTIARTGLTVYDRVARSVDTSTSYCCHNPP